MKMNVYSNNFENLVIFVGEFPEGKVLDVRATDGGMESDLDDAKSEWVENNPDADEDETAHAFAEIAEKLLQSESWYNDNYAWIDA